MRKARAARVNFSISVIAHNRLDLTRRCIDSVMQGGSGFELILTDNASTDGTAEYFEELSKSPLVTVVTNSENKGFAEPNTHALSLAKGNYFVTLNNDAEVPRGWLQQLERPFKEHDSAAISGPAGSCCSLNAGYPSFHGSPGPIYEYVEGSCLCIPTALARKHNLFADYIHFAYGEDLDLSLRMRARGYTIHQVPFTIKHQRSATAQTIPEIKTVQQRNHRALLDRWGNYLLYKKLNLPIVISRANALGDVLLTTPLIRSIRKQTPQSEIFVETKHPEMFLNSPHVKAAGGPFPQIYKWARKIDLDMSYENMPLTNIVDAYFKQALIMPEKDDDLVPDVFLSTQDRAFANDKIQGDDWIALHVGPSTWPGKQWAFDRWEELAQWLLSQGKKIVLIGSKGPNMPNYLDLRGELTIQKSAAVIERCKLFVGIDSLPIHLAQAMRTPVVGLFGATRPEYILNRALPSWSVCSTAACAGERHIVPGKYYVPCDGACMADISVSQVKKKIEEAL